MFRNFVFTLLSLIVILSWPLSLIKNPPHLQFQTIFYHDEVNNTQFGQKISPSLNLIRRITYNKYTPYFNRYFDNFLYFIDPSNYFFQGYPRDGLPNFVYRFKYPSVFLIIFIISSINFLKQPKKNLALGLYILIGLLLLPLFKFPDGFDLYFYFPITYILVKGLYYLKEKYYEKID